MARRKAERPAERGVRRAETNAVAAYLTALRAPKVPARSRAALEKRRAQIEQWLSEESSPIREVELIQQRLDIDAQLAQADQAQRLAELEEAFVKVPASWAERTGISAAALREVGVPARVLAGGRRPKGEGTMTYQYIPTPLPRTGTTTAASQLGSSLHVTAIAPRSTWTSRESRWLG